MSGRGRLRLRVFSSSGVGRWKMAELAQVVPSTGGTHTQKDTRTKLNAEKLRASPPLRGQNNLVMSVWRGRVLILRAGEVIEGRCGELARCQVAGGILMKVSMSNKQ